jgi:hypothetical protein
LRRHVAAPPACTTSAGHEVDELRRYVSRRKIAPHLESPAVLELVFERAAVRRGGAAVRPGPETLVARRLVRPSAVAIEESIQERADGLLERGLAGLVVAEEDVHARSELGAETRQATKPRQVDASQPHTVSSRFSNARRP